MINKYTNTTLIRITNKTFCAALIIKNGKVIESAPILYHQCFNRNILSLLLEIKNKGVLFRGKYIKNSEIYISKDL